MTYKQLRQITLQKMFATQGGEELQDDVTKDYLRALPSAANEGLMLMALTGECKTKRLSFAAIKGEIVELNVLAPDYLQCASGIFKQIGDETVQAEGWHIQGNIALVPQSGNYIMYYKAKPKLIQDNTAPDEVIDITEEAAVLLPLYIASELYKDDDAGLAAGYRNEFEAGREALMGRICDADYGFTQTAGWC
ncbi:MAG: hypothetical protein RR573_02905 [Oscillospiraceae bacterium]